MKKVIKNNYKIIIGFLLGLIVSVSSVYAIDAYIESNKVTYTNHNKTNVEEAIDELYERSGIHKEKWIDPVLNGADPVLKEPLIPVEIKSNGDVYYANLNSEWYNYSEKRWANAVILIDNPSNKNYKVGDHILESDIESYFVWIPRYQYKIWNEGKYSSVMFNVTSTKETAQAENALWRISRTRIIDVKFGTSNDIPKMNESEASLNKYYTHPAFTLGNKDLNGIWVGKFETGGTSANNLIVKPNVVSWRNQTAKEFFDAGKNFANSLDSHMMKNTEWGATVYLSHSEYGIGNEVNINNASDYYTGYSAVPGTDQSSVPSDSAVHTDGTKTQPWNTTVGYLAATTGNISGVYDMSGGAYDYVAGCKEGSPGNSGFDVGTLKQEMDKGYIDRYSVNSVMTEYNYRILGDATGEMGPFFEYFENNGASYYHGSWYGDHSVFVDSAAPWLLRGGGCLEGVIAGQFYFHRELGGASDLYCFRLVLAPNN